MFKFFKRLVRKEANKNLDANNYKTKIKNFSLEHDQIVGVNIDDVIIKIPYIDIVRISIMVYEEDLLPQPIWTVQTIKDIIDIPNELNNTDKLFFEVLNKKIEGYNSVQTQAEILKAMNGTHNSLFHIWQRHDADKIFKSIKY
ncbi:MULTISPECIES: hypothetical protein [Acinetobacter]|uniref:Uncharacterized protein n=1 Tax=Acinetobacter variabilis TaxID=70346 RepID=N8VKS7_9GAMM|nr:MULTISPECIES: hypothetical protein [Acinetobacter]AUX90624.1 hypothetical protein C3F22_12880 [Acinetobacter sp. ACNIH1]ENV00131.1 hypothetical protein F969_01040 [Acinetobacter variabilis]QKW81901.1 hypothetical protein FOC32_06145 [Acinetobacter sp. FDAARGOS_724]